MFTHEVVDAVNQFAVKLFTFFQRLIRSLTLADVRQDCSTLVELPVLTLHRHRIQLNVEVSSVFFGQLDFAGLLGLGLKDLSEVEVQGIPEALSEKARKETSLSGSVSLHPRDGLR